MTDAPRCSGGEQFPCASLAEALPHLRRPPAPAAIRFKIQSAADDAGQLVAYVDARVVYDRLDMVCGRHWWPRFGPLPRALVPRRVHGDGGPPPLFVRCRLTAFGVTREDVGEGADPKAAFSDAAKRAAVHFGVGRALYAMRAPWLRAGEADGELRRDARGALFVDERTDAWCREKYERWLEERGIEQFGEPLDHRTGAGDEERKGAPASKPAGAEASDTTVAATPIRPAA